jgi:hypothetical protein
LTLSRCAHALALRQRDIRLIRRDAFWTGDVQTAQKEIDSAPYGVQLNAAHFGCLLKVGKERGHRCYGYGMDMPWHALTK